MGGLYALKRFSEAGLSVVGLEAAADVGGVWYHNAYPGARVDVESLYYCYLFDSELYRDWKWTERFATQPELLRYFRHVADRYKLRGYIRFQHRVTSGVWNPDADRWVVTTEPGASFSARYLVMATGQLSHAKPPQYPGLDDFEGEWTQTAAWRDVPIDDRQVAVMGTGSSGVQAVTAISKRAAHLYVLQRTPGWVVPVKNGPFEPGEWESVAARVEEVWTKLLNSGPGIEVPTPIGKTTDFTPAARQQMMEEQWAIRPFNIFALFSDVNTDPVANEVLADFVRKKTAEAISDPQLESKLINRVYPIGARRVVFASDYYESFKRDNVTLIDLAEDPLERLIPSGLLFQSGREVEIDTIVFATGFVPFMGAVDAANIRNEHGARPSDHWARGPLTLLGLMTPGFPNLFFPTGPGSPSTLSSNLNLSNVHDINYIAEMIEHAHAAGTTRIEPTEEAARAWSAHVQDVAKDHLRLQDDNYMVQVAEDGSRFLIPYIGGVGEYVRRAAEIAANGYAGFTFS